MGSIAEQDSSGMGNHQHDQRPRSPTVLGIVRRICCGIRLSNCLLFYFIMFYGVYLTLGALGFSFFEEPVERELKKQLDLDIKSFLADHSLCVNGKQ